MDRRSRIAILVAQTEESYQEKFISGFLDKAFAQDYDVCVFAMYQRHQESVAREIGESSIYALIEYSQFDAVLLMLDTIQTPGVAKKIEEQVRAVFSGPVLCVDKESEYFPYIEMNYYSPVKKLITHLIEDHGMTDIVFVTGHKGHKHSTQRLQAYCDCMREHGLEVSEEQIFYGTYWYDSGEQIAEKILEQRDKLPQAIACANDYMAIGVCKKLAQHGIRIPEDIAVTGFDSVEEGRMSPSPLTSAELSARSYGAYAADCIMALFEGKDFPVFTDDTELFYGRSCGCHKESMVPKVILREQWGTDMSEIVFYSLNNHMSEDLLCQTNIYDFVKILDKYVYQIRDFDEFHICLNEDWNDAEKKEQEGRQKESFSRRVLHVLKCGSENMQQDTISFDAYFDRNQLLPELQEKHTAPRVYFFTPMYFEEKTFGYAAVCYENKKRSYSRTYRMWLRSVMQALECFRRIEAVQKSKQLLETSMIRDALTGLYNYNGFLRQKDQLVRKIIRTGAKVGVLAIDIKELMKINETYGRAEGDRTIIALSHALEDTFSDGVSACFGNGEMVTILMSVDNVEEQLQLGYESVMRQVTQYIASMGKDYVVETYYGIETSSPKNEEELERLVNVAVSKKNGSKMLEKKMLQGQSLSEEEYKEALIVQELLNENRFMYHFQPIVDAKTGEIFGYEALMRPDVNPYMPPPVVLKYAEYYDRLYDVERETFFNVLGIINSQSEAIHDAKIFINSIPGNLLHGEDAEKLELLVQKLKGKVVVELTEQLEVSDSELAVLKDYYNKIGFQTAIDDYGAGYSNVTNLLRYMPNCVKIDRMLLSGIQDSPQKQHFVKDIITFAHDNDILALAEGVETSEELQMVIRLGVDLIQGYYTARPAKEIIPSISRAIRNEIIEINRIEKSNRGHRVYMAGKESRISIAKLAAEKYAIIELTGETDVSREVQLIGVPELDTDMLLRVRDGYRGKIILDNVILRSKEQNICVDIGNDCDVTLVLHGENRFMSGGIRVPEGSSLTVEGNGNLSITADSAYYFGIGNSMDEEHGNLLFEQDGTIDIYGNGMIGIAIGSGLGGKIQIKKGKYVLHLAGQEGVGIGTFSGNFNSEIRDCDVQIDISAAKAVGIGSMSGTMNLHMERFKWIGKFNADDVVGIGTLEGTMSVVEIYHAYLFMDIRAYKACGIGSYIGDTSLAFVNCTVLITGEGSEVISFGNHKRTAKIDIRAAKVESRMKTALLSVVGAQEQDITMDSGECLKLSDGEKVVHHAEGAEK